MIDANGTERMAQLERALLRSLESLDRGDVDGAREELMRVAPATQPEPLGTSISDGELDAAFDEAQPEHERMLDADSVAQAAIAEADRALAMEADDESLAHAEADGALAMEADDESLAHAEAAQLPHEFGTRFVTATMAELLEGQGELEAASRIRSALEVPAQAARPEARPDRPRKPRDHVVRELETWLDNLRGGART